MAELSVPYVKRQLSRGGGSGGGGRGVVSQPQIPDVSGLGRQQAQLFGQVGTELSEAADQYGQIARAKQKARDTATITQLEATVDEQVAFKAQELMRDARIHPFDYREQLQGFRDGLLSSMDVPDRLKGLATAKVQASTSKYLIDIDAMGTKKGVEQALQTLDLRSDQLIRKSVEEGDPNQRGVIDTQIRDLYASYVESGILSAPEAMTRLQKTRDQSAVYQVEQAIRLDPDGSVAQLEKGMGANVGIPPEAYGKLLDKARAVQRERFDAVEEREAKSRRDTKIAQEESEAVTRGRLQKGQAVNLDALLSSREISPQGYERMMSYKESKARDDRSEARARESLALQRQERHHREVDAQLSIMAITGQKDTAGIIDYAKQKGLPATAIDGAIAKAQSYQTSLTSEFRTQHNEAQALLSKAFTKGPFETLTPVTAEAYSAALDELTRRSKAFGGTEDPIKIAQEIIPQYQESLSGEQDIKLNGLLSRLRYASPHELMEAQPSIPPTMFKEQQKLFKEIDTLLGTQKRLDAAMSTPEKTTSTGTGTGLWQRFFGPSPGGQALDEFGRPKGKP